MTAAPHRVQDHYSHCASNSEKDSDRYHLYSGNETTQRSVKPTSLRSLVDEHDDSIVMK